MRMEKMLRILNALQTKGVNIYGGFVYGKGTGELVLSFKSQPERDVHEYLLHRDFVVVDDVYVYRPR